MKKIIPIVVVVLLVGLIGYKIWAKIMKDQAMMAQAGRTQNQGRSSVPMVRAVPVAPESIKQTLKVVGTVEADSELAVQPRINGRLVSLLVDEGASVRTGQLLAVMDDESIRLQLQQSEAALASIRANLQQAELNAAKNKAERDRYQELLKQRYISQRDFDNVENAYLTSQASLEGLKAQYNGTEKNHELLKIQLNQTKITSPLTGVVTGKLVTEGVNLTTGSTIVTVAALNQVKVVFNIDQKDAPAFRKGNTVSFTTDAFGEQRFTGRINEVAPIFDPKTRTLSMNALINNPERKLLPGMFGTAEVLLGSKENVLAVPVEAVVTQNNRSGVFVAEGKTARFRPVETGLMAEGKVEIASGLKQGEPVIVIGQNRLRDGQPIELMGGGNERRRNGGASGAQPQGSSPGGERPAQESRKAGGGR